MNITSRFAVVIAATVASAATLLSVGPPPALAALAPAPVLTTGPCSVSVTWTGADSVQLSVGSTQLVIPGDTATAAYGADYLVPAGQSTGVEVYAFVNGSIAGSYNTMITPTCNTGSNVHVTKVVQGPVPVGGLYTIGLYAMPANVV